MLEQKSMGWMGLDFILPVPSNLITAALGIGYPTLVSVKWSTCSVCCHVSYCSFCSLDSFQHV